MRRDRPVSRINARECRRQGSGRFRVINPPRASRPDLPRITSVLRLISDLDDLRETLGRSELQFYGLALAEERFAAAGHNWIDIEIEHVEQALLQQRLAEETMTQNEEIAAVPLLELGHFRRDVATNDRRVVPRGCLQLRRKNVFSDRIET